MAREWSLPGWVFLSKPRRGISVDAWAAEFAGRAQASLHTIIPAFMEKDEIHIGFGIMGGWNQAQAHAKFVANVVEDEWPILRFDFWRH